MFAGIKGAVRGSFCFILVLSVWFFAVGQAEACYLASAMPDPLCGPGYFSETYSLGNGLLIACCEIGLPGCDGTQYGIPYTCPNGVPNTLTSTSGSGAQDGLAGLINPGPPAVTCSSIIRADSQVLQERIPLVGVPFSLTYSSDKVPGNVVWYSLQVPLTSGGITGSLVEVTAIVSIPTNHAGCASTTTLTDNDTTPANNDVWNVTWNGQDSCSNDMHGASFPVTVTTQETNSPPNSGEVAVPSYTFLGTSYVNPLGNNGWDVSIHHSYDSVRQVLYSGDGSSYGATSFTDPSYSGYNIVMSQDGSEAYFFNSSSNQHIYTKTGLVGATKYTFAYSSGQLSTITDAYSNVTTFYYTSGHLSSIVGPYGQTTSVTTSSVSGTYYITAVTNPNSETYNMTYYTGGLLNTFEKPSGTTNTLTYDSLGHLTEDSSSAGNSDSLSLTYGNSNSWTSSESSALSRSTTHSVTDVQVGTYEPSYQRVDTDPAGYNSYTTVTPTNLFSSQSIGYSNSLSYGESDTSTSDARFGSNLPFINSKTITNSASMSYAATQTATLGTANDPFSVTAYEEDYTINSNDSSLAWSSGTNTYTYTSPEGRYFYRIIDGNERTTSTQLASLTALTYSYDGNGRLSEIEQGGSRTTNFAYYSSGASKGLLHTVEDAASHTTTFAYDNAGRVSSETLPDSRVIDFSYDSNGNLYTVTPPGKSAHTLNHNGFDLLSSYVTPTAMDEVRKTVDIGLVVLK